MQAGDQHVLLLLVGLRATEMFVQLTASLRANISRVGHGYTWATSCFGQSGTSKSSNHFQCIEDFMEYLDLKLVKHFQRQVFKLFRGFTSAEIVVL